MKRLMVFLCCLILILSAVTGCGGEEPGGSEGAGSGVEISGIPGAESSSGAGSAGLSDIRKAAEDSGYTVSDDYMNFFLKDIKDGFSVQIVADGQDVIYSILECETEEAAKANAKEIDDAGYSIAIREGKYLTSYGADNAQGEVKEILATLLKGEAVK